MSVPYGTSDDDFAPLTADGVSAVSLSCSTSSNTDFLLLGVDTPDSWQVLGAYTAYALTGTSVGNRKVYGSGGDALYSYPIAASTATSPGGFLYETQSAVSGTPYGYYSGSFTVALTSGFSTSHSQVTFSLFSAPGTGCQGTATVTPS